MASGRAFDIRSNHADLTVFRGDFREHA
jgi:hypothetical protein